MAYHVKLFIINKARGWVAPACAADAITRVVVLRERANLSQGRGDLREEWIYGGVELLRLVQQGFVQPKVCLLHHCTGLLSTRVEFLLARPLKVCDFRNVISHRER
jgi:hypothetical protein